MLQPYQICKALSFLQLILLVLKSLHIISSGILLHQLWRAWPILICFKVPAFARGPGHFIFVISLSMWNRAERVDFSDKFACWHIWWVNYFPCSKVLVFVMPCLHLRILDPCLGGLWNKVKKSHNIRLMYIGDNNKLNLIANYIKAELDLYVKN